MAEEKKEKCRRLKGVLITGRLLEMFLLSRTVNIKIQSSIPETATFYTAYFDHSRNAFVVFFEDESFDCVPEGELVPICNVVYKDLNFNREN